MPYWDGGRHAAGRSAARVMCIALRRLLLTRSSYFRLLTFIRLPDRFEATDGRLDLCSRAEFKGAIANEHRKMHKIGLGKAYTRRVKGTSAEP